MIDLGMLRRLHAYFVAAMPRVTPFYAMKCMPEKVSNLSTKVPLQSVPCR